MNKQEFMMKIRYYLKGIPESDLDELLFDYEEHFEVGLKEGRSEDEIAFALGNPKTLAKEIKANYMITKVEGSFTATNFISALLATIGLGFFNLVFILGPFLGIAGALFAIIVSGLAISFSGVIAFISVFLQPVIPELINNPFHPVVTIFISIGLTAFGLLWTIGSYYLNKVFYQFTVQYLKFNLNIIVNRRDKNE